jgi:hypothetical protein
MGGTCSIYRRQERGYKVLAGRTEVKKSLGRFRRRRKNNIKMYLQKWNEILDWTGPALQRTGGGIL